MINSLDIAGRTTVRGAVWLWRVGSGWGRYVLDNCLPLIDAGGGLDILVEPYNHQTPALYVLLNETKGN